MENDREMTHALSFDIEDWFHMVEIEAVEDPATWPDLPSIVVHRTRQILETLKEFDTRATFFVLGWVAQRYPELVRMIAEGGHEIGAHSFWHRKVYELDKETFQADLKESIDVLEGHGGGRVHGFRAPSFSIVPGVEWAFEAMKELGLAYDSSLFPGPRGHGGYPCQPGPHWVRFNNTRFAELPVSVSGLGPFKMCFTGGGYLRLLPAWAVERSVRQEARSGRPALVYLHPRDFAVDCPRVAMPLYRRFKCYVGLHTTDGKLRRLLNRYRFDTCCAVLKQNLKL